MKSKEKEKIHTSSWLCLHWKPWKNWKSSKEQEQEPHPYSGESKSSAAFFRLKATNKRVKGLWVWLGWVWSYKSKKNGSNFGSISNSSITWEIKNFKS